MAQPHPLLFDLAAGRPPSISIADPGALVASAREHRMTGLLAVWLREEVIDLPLEQAKALAVFDLDWRAHGERLWDALGQVTKRFIDLGVEIASFKGITSDARWYSSMGARPGADLDLLLSPHDLDRIEDIVAVFRKDHPLSGVAQEMAARGHIQHIDFRGAEGVYVDLHFDPIKVLIPSRNYEEVWSRTEMISFTDRGDFRVLDPETALIQSVLHLNKDRFSRLLGFVDPVRIVQSEDIDWAYVDGFVRRDGLEIPFYEGLVTVFTTLNLAPPVPGPGLGWRARLWRLVWRPQTRLTGALGDVTKHRRQFWIPLLAKGRFIEGVRRLWQVAFPPRDLLAHYHPASRGPYLWRILVGRLKRDRERQEEAARVRELER